jgi:hypothetical protein
MWRILEAETAIGYRVELEEREDRAFSGKIPPIMRNVVESALGHPSGVSKFIPLAVAISKLFRTAAAR